MCSVKIRLFLTVSLIFGISALLISCKSLARAHADSREFGGKEPIPRHERKQRTPRKVTSTSTKKRNYSTATKPKAKPKISSKSKAGPAAKEKEIERVVKIVGKKKTPVPVIDDEAFLMKEIPPAIPQVAKKDQVVPGVDDLINPGGPIRIKEDSSNRILNAGGKDVIVSGNDGVIVITGGCAKLTLKGKNNQIQCDSVESIEIAGDENTLILGSIGGGTIRGDRNNLSWGSGVDGLSPIVESFGSDNSMKRLE